MGVDALGLGMLMNFKSSFALDSPVIIILFVLSSMSVKSRMSLERNFAIGWNERNPVMVPPGIGR